MLDGEMRAPSATFEYMLYQALIGIWQPNDESLTQRMQAYGLKAAREGKQETSWLNPHEGYEKGVDLFIERILDRSLSAEFLHSFGVMAQRVSLLGALNSLSQLTLKATLPGVPDFYQVTEHWDSPWSILTTDDQSILHNVRRNSPCLRRPIGAVLPKIGRMANSSWLGRENF
jgi:(1->4)-alpha-D-glucan 1-alpha-D-glucosylmutase